MTILNGCSPIHNVILNLLYSEVNNMKYVLQYVAMEVDLSAFNQLTPWLMEPADLMPHS